MNKRVKRAMALITAVAVAVMFIIKPGSGTITVKAATTAISLSTEVDFGNVIKQLENGDVKATLSADIELASSYSINAGTNTLTIDLNGWTLTDTNNKGLFSITGGTVAITDSSEAGTGKMVSGASTVVNVTGGTLAVTGGQINSTGSNGTAIDASAGCIEITGGTITSSQYVGLNISSTSADANIIANIKGGSLSGSFAALRIGSNCNVTIGADGGKPQFDSSNSAVFMPADAQGSKQGNTLTINGGSFTATNSGGLGYPCYFCGIDSTLTITGGEFNLNADSGSSLVIGENVADANVSISGGTYNGRIARFIKEGTDWNYTTYYGDGTAGSGILAKGAVLTNNTFTDVTAGVDKHEPTVFTVDAVEVVAGGLVCFNTQRSTLETYDYTTDEEATAAYNADFCSLLPASIGTDGTVYTNRGSGVTPELDTARIDYENSYEFLGWLDSEGNEYATLEAYAKAYAEACGTDGVEGADGADGAEVTEVVDTAAVTLSAIYKAQVSTPEGLKNAVENCNAVKTIEAARDIDTGLYMDTDVAKMQGRTLDLSSHKISYTPSDSDSSNPAFILNGSWTVKNGTVESSSQACFELGGDTIMSGLYCKSTGYKYAVSFGNGIGSSSISSSTIETTSEDGYALKISGADENMNITTLFGIGYPSSTVTKTVATDVYLNAAKLLVSDVPITYMESGADIDFGASVYGDKTDVISQTVSNMDYIGDIKITDISVDNPAFVVTEDENAARNLLGGSSDTYSYMVTAKPNQKPGSYEGKVCISFTKMDGSEGEYKQLVLMNITQRQLEVEGQSVEKTKTYDGSSTATASGGTLTGVIGDDDVSFTVDASYDDADAGEGKTISVKYTLTGEAKEYYLAPQDETYQDGVIEKAQGTAEITIQDYRVGEDAVVGISSTTNGNENVTLYYKQKGEADTAYGISAPQEEGNYTLKAVFAESKNFHTVEITADFAVSYIATPEVPYTLQGTWGNDGWYTSSVTIIPAEGYVVSTQNDGDYQTSCTVESSAQPVIYLKGETGAVTKPIQVEQIQIDKVAPVMSGIEDGQTYYADRLRFTVADDNLASVTVDGELVAFSGNTATVSLMPTGNRSIIIAKDKAGNTTTYSVIVEETWVRDGISAAGVRTLIKGKAYKLGSGQWTVDGDNTVYNGDIDFYVNTDGDYDFQKQ